MNESSSAEPPVEKREREISPPKADVLQKNINSLTDRVAELERFKTEQAQFVFQTVAIIITLLALTIGVPVAVVSRLQLGSTVLGEVAVGLLLGVFVILAIWLVLWYRVNFVRRPRRRRP